MKWRLFMKKQNLITWSSDIFMGVIFTFIAIALALIITINFKPLFYHDIDSLNLVERSGYSKEVIIRNYDALIEYCSPFFTDSLSFPDFAASPSGLFHFEEVKNIFNFIYICGLISLIIYVTMSIFKLKNRHYSFIKVSWITAILLPAVIAALCAINFNKLFIRFHEIVFDNNDWIFDYRTDPVILILPEEFFMHCLVMIIVLVVLLAMAMMLTYKLVKKKYASNH